MKQGFTLIELLVVVLIIGILAAVAVSQYQKAVQKTRAVEAITTMDSFKKAMQLYILRNGIPANEDDRIAFTGEVKSDVLDMNISCIREQEDSCFTKYWEYAALCDTRQCMAQSIAREHLPSMALQFGINASGSVSYECDYFSPEGEAFCKTLPSPWSDNIVAVD